MLEEVKRILDAERDDQASFLAQLVSIPSDNPPGDCAAHADAAATLLEAMGFVVERHVVPAAEVAAVGMRSVTNLVVRHRFGDGPTLALNAHGDVVPPGEGWTVAPYGGRIVDGRLYGRGAAVSKSDFATYAFALRALRDAGTALRGTVELHLTYDEEAGGEIGPKWLLDQGISRPDIAIAAGLSYGVVTAHNGVLHLEIELRGRSAHAAKPETGADALEAATAVLQALYAHRKSYRAIRSRVDGIGSPNLVVGLIRGGINTNVVPDQVTLRLDRRIIPEETPDAVEAELRQVVEAAGTAGVTCGIRRVMAAAPLAPTPASEALASVVCRHATRIFGEPVETAGVPLYTDARHYAARGIPIVLYGTGPRSFVDAGAHGADEHVLLDDLWKATEVVAASICELLGT
ncbi:succinyl-diaminopimelate desuccinylase [Constrictibacter sp. MBR-5]|jgi:acetylornithine deacetylase/succinyl-diaminopimelate desuccinylase family protein|uniref:ArgE/DapE family deacylase n=1 Tax=Constrictibacter sp. MBR-5 TaxID=3156467 RepID=UPI0033977A9B